MTLADETPVARRCACRSIAPGSYANSVTLPDPPAEFGFTKSISVDACIAAEIQSLWRMGIKTVASCCGHNRRPGVIAVPEEYDERMKALGYDPGAVRPTGGGVSCWAPQYRRVDQQPQHGWPGLDHTTNDGGKEIAR